MATAAETTPEVAGKPHRPTADAIRARATDLTMMVGDRPSTDGALARQLGIPFALVLSGVTDAATCRPIRPRTRSPPTWPASVRAGLRRDRRT